MGNEKRSRRWFLRSVVYGGAGLVLAGSTGLDKRRYSPELQIFVDREDGLSFEMAADLARRFDYLSDLIDRNGGIHFDVTKELVLWWVKELVPLYQIEGAVDSPVMPQEEDFIDFVYGLQHTRVFGTSDCASTVEINGRMRNPVSTWYQTWRFLPVVAHELAHLQQGNRICRKYDDEAIEGTAQIVTLEILSSLANQGNRDAAFSLVKALSRWGLQSAFAAAVKEHRLGDYHRLFGELVPGVFGEGIYQEEIATWDYGSDSRSETAYRYYWKPFSKIARAILLGDDYIDGLALNRSRPYFEGSSPADELSSFQIDDTIFFIKHAEEIVERLIRYGKEDLLK